MQTESQHADGVVIRIYKNGQLVSMPVFKWPNKEDGYSIDMFNAMIEVIFKDIKDLAVVASEESYDSRTTTRKE